MFTDKDGNTINYDNNNEDNIPNNIEITGVDEQKLNTQELDILGVPTKNIT